MIQDLYLSIGVISFLTLFYQLRNFNKIYFIYEWYDKFTKITKNKPKINDFRTKSEWDIFNKVNIFIIFDFLWILGLIFTEYYYFTILYFLILFLFKLFFLKKNKWTIVGKIVTFFSIFLKIIICFFILYYEFLKEIISSFL